MCTAAPAGIYQRLEARRVRSSDVERAARAAEVDLIGRLEQNEDAKGIIDVGRSLDPELPAFLRAWRDRELPGGSGNEPLPQPNPDLFGAYVDDLLAVDLQALGRRPPDQDSWSEDASPDETAARCARKLVHVVHPVRARVHAEFFRAERGASGATVERDAIRVRTVFALRFGHARTDDGEQISQDAVRAAFNSPFRPFVLTSTSIGQEGLDFHPWCHRLVHWNLPGNPVDLEQREGRIHRYKGHAVRRNVAAAHADDAFEALSAGDDIWTLMFELADKAARAAGKSDLVPHWMAPGRRRVERHVPQLPYTAEVEAFDRLKRQLAAYRVVFGQPRQEELVTLLDRAGVDVERLRDWAVDLSPPVTRCAQGT